MGACWAKFLSFLKNERSNEPMRYSKLSKRGKVPVEFESLLEMESEEENQTGSFVTQAEIHSIRTGKWNDLLTNQRRRDEEMDKKLADEETQLKREQEAYYAAKREAAKASKQRKDKLNQDSGHASFTSISLHGKAPVQESKPSSDLVKEEDFDKFLENIKKRTGGLTSSTQGSAFAVSDHDNDGDSNGDDENVDFGFWEKASDEDDKAPVLVIQ